MSTGLRGLGIVRVLPSNHVADTASPGANQYAENTVLNPTFIIATIRNSKSPDIYHDDVETRFR